MTARKDTALARRRRDIVELAKVAEAMPTAYVESPIHTVLSNAQSIVATELAFIRAAQARPNAGPMSPAEAKKVTNLVTALEKAVAIGRELSDHELSNLSDEELATQLMAELERLRAKGVRT